jgi:hypothetical protein
MYWISKWKRPWNVMPSGPWRRVVGGQPGWDLRWACCIILIVCCLAYFWSWTWRQCAMSKGWSVSEAYYVTIHKTLPQWGPQTGNEIRVPYTNSEGNFAKLWRRHCGQLGHYFIILRPRKDVPWMMVMLTPETSSFMLTDLFISPIYILLTAIGLMLGGSVYKDPNSARKQHLHLTKQHNTSHEFSQYNTSTWTSTVQYSTYT